MGSYPAWIPVDLIAVHGANERMAYDRVSDRIGVGVIPGGHLQLAKVAQAGLVQVLWPNGVGLLAILTKVSNLCEQVARVTTSEVAS